MLQIQGFSYTLTTTHTSEYGAYLMRSVFSENTKNVEISIDGILSMETFISNGIKRILFAWSSANI